MRIGVDVGGTKIEAIALDAASRELARQRIDTPKGDYAGTVGAITALVFEIERRLGRKCSVGLGIPGTVSPATGLIKNANSTWLIGRPFDKDLAAALERPVRLSNDANCFALSEAADGAGAGARTVFGVILGTGCGGGIVIDGNVLTGVNAIGGEWGHNPLPWPRDDERPGPECYCGNSGCIETFVSGTGLERDYLAATGRAASAERIAASAEPEGEPEPEAAAALARYEGRLARALASVINIVDPEVIVLGGGMSNVKRLYANVPGLWTPFVFSDKVATRLAPPVHRDSSGVRGAAWLWPEENDDP
jgi:fructokinase